MCGIAGLYTKRGQADHRVVQEMTGVLSHRGPMDEGYLSRPTVGLGMRRLSIIDIAGGHQPVFNEDRTIAVILNGEIYNYRELREELQSRGHRFSTNSDTEVIVHLYEDSGEACLAELNGMFAFAVWDDRLQRLFLARDRLGEKPLYYFEDADRLAFASELKALLVCPFVPRRPDPGAVIDFLTFNYIRAPRSPFEGVRKLLPGHYLTADARGVRVACYWSLREHQTSLDVREPEAVERLRWLIRDSVRIQLRSDVPVGAFLSGGIDSSTIVAHAAQASPYPVQTFTVDFGPDSFDEVRYARVVARTFGTDHRETVATVDDAIQELPRLVWHMDEPSADSAIVPAYLVSRFAASAVRVVLAGSGGDEVFGGYMRYFDGRPADHVYRFVARGVPEAAGRALMSLAPRRVHGRLRWNNLPDAERYLAQVSNFAPVEQQALLGEVLREDADFRTEFAAYPDGDRVNRRLFVDTITYLPDDILHIADRMSMAVSLEARAPLLDYRLVEFCAGLPGHFKVRQVARSWKILLKKAMDPVLPPEILTRVKWGFGAPIHAWMNRGLLPVVRRLYESSEAVRCGLLRPAGVAQQLTRVGSGVPGFRAAQRLWALLILEIWCRVFLGRDGASAPRATLQDLVG